jgi:hypothetical protein
MGNFRANLHFTMPHVVRISLVLTSLFFPASMKVHSPLLGLLFFKIRAFRTRHQYTQELMLLC